MKKIIILLFSLTVLVGCSKMEEKKNVSDNKSNQKTEDPHKNIPGMENAHKDNMMDMQTESGKDPKAGEISKAAYDFENNYKKDKSDAVKKQLIEKHMAAGNYLMLEANIPPKEKYSPALKHYKRVLELDPENAEAIRNKKQIEEIYEMMGRPIPQ